MTSILPGYEAAWDRAAWCELDTAQTIALTGPDRVAFLHNMISNDVEHLRPMNGRRGTLLTPTGKLIAEFFYALLPEAILLTFDGWDVSRFVDSIESYIIMDDVTCEIWTAEFGQVVIQGPNAGETLAELFTAEPPQDGELLQLDWRQHCVFWIAPGTGHQQLVVERPLMEPLRARLEALQSEGVEEMSRKTLELLALERGIPLAGVDMTADTNPLEAGLLEAIDYEKGCYVGQEVIARATHIGGVPRKLVQLHIDSDTPVAADASLFAPDRKRPVGRITRCAQSPRLGAVIAMATVRTAFSGVESRLKVESGSDLLEATVTPAGFEHSSVIPPQPRARR